MAEDQTRVFLRKGRVAHLLPYGWSPNGGYAISLCGRQPDLFDYWFGTGTQEEHDEAASLPLCKGCAKRKVPQA